jgi:ribosomal protein S6E (S10)
MVAIRGGSTMEGTLLALNRTVRIRGGSQVVGSVIANEVKISKHSRVLTPETNR